MVCDIKKCFDQCYEFRKYRYKFNNQFFFLSQFRWRWYLDPQEYFTFSTMSNTNLKNNLLTIPKYTSSEKPRFYYVIVLFKLFHKPHSIFVRFPSNGDEACRQTNTLLNVIERSGHAKIRHSHIGLRLRQRYATRGSHSSCRNPTQAKRNIN